MSGTIKFYHPEETFTYHIKRVICKVVYQKKKHYLIMEVFSTDSLDHVDEDSLQNEYPEVYLSIDDFPIDIESIEDLAGQEIKIPLGVEEVLNEEDELEDIYYTTVSVNDNEAESNDNIISFSKENPNTFTWTGYTDDFTGKSDGRIKFKINGVISQNLVRDNEFEE